MKELNLKHEAKRYGCAVLAATIMALNIKSFVRAGRAGRRKDSAAYILTY